MNSTTQITTNNITNVTTDKLEITIIYISHFTVITLIILFAIIFGTVGFNCGISPTCRKRRYIEQTKSLSLNDIV